MKKQVIDFYLITGASCKRIAELFGITKSQAELITDEAIAQVKSRRRMELMVESGAEYNPEMEIENFKH